MSFSHMIVGNEPQKTFFFAKLLLPVNHDSELSKPNYQIRCVQVKVTSSGIVGIPQSSLLCDR